MFENLKTYNHWEMLFQPIFSGWIYAVIVGVLLMSLWFSWRSSRRLADFKRRRNLLILRAFSMAGVALLLARPALDLKKAEEIPGVVAVIVDRSKSMDLKVGQESRGELVRKSLIASQDTFRKFEQKYPVVFYEMGKGLELIDWDHLVDPQFKNHFNQTDIGSSLSALRSLYGGEKNLSAVLLFSDGADRGVLEAKLKADQKIPMLEDFPAPIHTFQPGEERQFMDLAVTNVVYDEFGFVKTPLNVEVELEMEGFDRKTIPVTLKEGHEILATKTIELVGDGKPVRVDFRFSPKVLGAHVYTVTVPNYEEEVIQSNNERSFVIRIIRDKVRVLHVAGHPSWDEKFLRLALKGNPNIDLIAFYILRTRDDILFDVSQDELSLIPFPVQELFGPELETFDLVIFQDFDFRAFFPLSYLENLKNFVEKGGGFMMLGGKGSFSAGGYAGTPVASVLPFSINMALETAHSYTDENYRLALSPAGSRHPVTRLHPDTANNQELWRLMPGLNGRNAVGEALPGAVVLATKSEAGRGTVPILAVREVGKGRTLALATDSSWQWSFHRVRDGGTSEAYLTFVKNAIRWLVGDPVEALVEIEIASPNLQEGEKSSLVVKARDRSYRPNTGAAVNVEIKKGADGEKIWEKQGKTDPQGRFSTEFELSGRGHYLIHAKVPLPDGGLSEAETVIAVEGVQGEFLRPRINIEILRTLALKTKGHYTVLPAKITPDIKPRFDYRVSAREIIPLWNNFLALLLLALPLALEWWYRRQKGLA